MRWKYLLALLIAVANDGIDYLGVGSLPVAGDVLDLASSALLFPLIGGYEPFLTLAELIPGVDLLPTYTVLVLWSWHRRPRW